MTGQGGPALAPRVAQWACYTVLGLLLALILTGVLPLLLSPTLARRVSYNSEAYLFAIVLAAWIQFGLPRITVGTRTKWGIAHGFVWALIGAGLLLSGWPSRVVTLNESAFALAFLIPYVSVRRPLSRWVPGVVVSVLVGLTIWAVAWRPESWLIDQAETVGFIVLAMVTLDFFDRRLLQLRAQAHSAALWAWYGFLVLEPVLVSALGTSVRAGPGAKALTLGYLGRIHESFIGVLLVSLILSLTRATRPTTRVESPIVMGPVTPDKPTAPQATRRT